MPLGEGLSTRSTIGGIGSFLGPVSNLDAAEGFEVYVDPETNVKYELPKTRSAVQNEADTARIQNRVQPKSVLDKRIDAVTQLNRMMGAAPSEPVPENPFLRFDLQSRDPWRWRAAKTQSEHFERRMEGYNKAMAARAHALDSILRAQGEADKTSILASTAAANERRAGVQEAAQAQKTREYEESLKGQKDIQEKLRQDILQKEEDEQGLTRGTLTKNVQTKLTPQQIRMEMARQQALAGGSLTGPALMRRMQEEMKGRYGLAPEQAQTPMEALLREVSQASPEFAQQLLSQVSGTGIPVAPPQAGSEAEYMRSLLQSLSPEQLQSLVQVQAEGGKMLQPQIPPTVGTSGGFGEAMGALGQGAKMLFTDPAQLLRMMGTR